MGSSRGLRTAAALVLIGASVLGGPIRAAGKGLGSMPARGGIVVAGSPYRYLALAPRHPRRAGRTTVVERVDRRGGRVGRWWFLRGSWVVPAVAYDLSGGGLSADGGTLVLTALRYAYPRRGRWHTRFAVLDTAARARFPGPTGEQRVPGAVRRISLRGDWGLDAVSPDGSTAYLFHHPAAGDPSRYEVRALDLRSGRLRPRPLFDYRRQRKPVSGVPITAVSSRDGRHAYTLYDGNGDSPYLQALDTRRGRLRTVALPQLRGVTDPLMLKLALRRGRLLIRGRSPNLEHRRPLLRLDRRTLRPRAGRFLPAAKAHSHLLAFTRIPRHPDRVIERVGVAGRSAEGRRVRLRQYGTPAIPGRVLVFGCIHGDECAGRKIEPLAGGCPDPQANIYLVPNLDPDGSAAGTRLNGRGVDLNRNFNSQWQRIGRRGDPQYSGPGPFSEPESRLAARIIRRLRPRVTIWLHQHRGPLPFVRAWGQSAPAGRRLAELARIPFHLLDWPAGTAPNWQNHRFPDTASFVVELPAGSLDGDLRQRLARAIDLIGRREGRVGED